MSNAPPEKLDVSRLATVTVHLLERNNEVASGLRAMLRGAGMAGVKTFLTPDQLEASLSPVSPDVLILSENENSNIFEITKRVRHVTVGKNPFMVILLLLSPDNQESIKAALKSGADSALVKPVASAQLVERIGQLAFKRAPFIAVSYYIGPDRAAAGRTADTPLIQTINTLRYKLQGKAVAPEALDKAIMSVTPQLWLSQLKSHGVKLKASCDAILEHQRAQRPVSELKTSLMDLVAGLEEAATTTRKVQNADAMLRTCQELAKEIQLLANETESLDEKKISKLGMIPAAFDLALQRLAPPA